VPLRLDTPSSEDALYLDRGHPVDPWRPIMQGDVFEQVQIPGLADHERIMLVSHPCSMRGADGALKPKLQAVPVDPHQAVPLDRWAIGYLRVLPLPDLLEDGSHHAARLTEFGMVDTAALDLDSRIACLSERGILLLQQRFVASLTRVAVDLPTLDGASRSVLIEAELLEDWNIGLAQPAVVADEDRSAVLAREAREFDRFMSTPADAPPRRELSSEAGRADVRRRVRAEIHRRTAAATQGA
jgi:hypothetical protein